MNFFAANIKALRIKKGLKQAELAEKLGFPRTTWSSYEQEASQPGIDELLRIADFFGVTMDALLSRDLGFIADSLTSNVHLITKDSSAKKHVKSTPKLSTQSPPNYVSEPEIKYSRMPSIVTVDQAGRDNIVLVNARARAGYLAGYEDPEWIETLPSYSLPGLNHGTYRMFEVTGQSMVPTFHESDLLIGRFVENFNEIRDNRIYIVVSRRDGVVVKRVVNRVHREGKLILNSDNQRHRGEYPPIVLNPEDVAEIWYTVSYISRQMREPGEVYNRLIDLESRLTLLEHTRKNDPPKLNGN